MKALVVVAVALCEACGPTTEVALDADDDFQKACVTADDCVAVFFGDVCLVHLSQVCVGGSSVDYCAMFGAEVITLAEFQSIVAQGWVRPDDGYHTIAVAEDFGNCPGDGYSNVGIPGWGEFNLFQCGEDANYCNRAIACVTR